MTSILVLLTNFCHLFLKEKRKKQHPPLLFTEMSHLFISNTTIYTVSFWLFTIQCSFTHFQSEQSNISTISVMSSFPSCKLTKFLFPICLSLLLPIFAPFLCHPSPPHLKPFAIMVVIHLGITWSETTGL